MDGVNNLKVQERINDLHYKRSIILLNPNMQLRT